MSKKKKQKAIFNEIQKKTNVSEKKIKDVAKGINPKDLSDEKKVRQLIAQVSKIAGTSVSKEKEDQIVNYLTKNKLSMQEMEAMINMFMQQKR